MRQSLWTFALGVALMGQPVSAQAQETADPPGTAGIMARYRLWFAAADANKDGVLDKEELAKAFRGPSAKPFDYVAPPKETKDKPEEKDKADKKEGTPADEKDKPSEKDKPTRKPDYSRYPDYNFLIQLDANSDETISKGEFETWARELSVQIKTQLEAQQRLLELQTRLQRDPAKIKPNDKKKLEADLKREREQIAKLQQQMQKLQKNFTQAKPKTR